MVRAYADDIAVVFYNASKILPQLIFLYGQWERATCMTLNRNNCVVIPLSWRFHKNFCTMMREFAAEWVEVEIAGKAKYLGVFIGPDAGGSSLASPLRK